MDTKLIVSASPHVRSEETTQSLMANVIVALCPCVVASAIIFGMRALLVTAVSVVACVAFEWLYCKLLKKPNPISDLSAVVTGIILAMNVPVGMPIGQLIIGDLVAIVIVKQLFGGIGITQTTVSSFVVMLLLCIAAVVLGSNLQKRPSRRQVLVEKGVTMLYDMVESTMGKHNSYWTPYIGALFLSSICGSFIGMTGIFRSSTADLSTTVTWALMTSFICWGCSIKRNGVGGWLKGFTEPIVVMTPMNLVSEIAQPISMAFRHFGNIAGGSVLTSLVYSALATVSAAVLGLVGLLGKSVIVGVLVLTVGAALLYSGVKTKKLARKIFGIVFAATGALSLLGLTGVPYLEVGVPGILSLYFDIFSGGVQALVFSLLTMVYVGNACPPPEKA